MRVMPIASLIQGGNAIINFYRRSLLLSKLEDVDSRFISLLDTKIVMRNVYRIDVAESDDRDSITEMWNYRFIEIKDNLRKYFLDGIVEYYDTLQHELNESRFPFPLMPEFRNVYIYDSTALFNSILHEYPHCLTAMIDLIVTYRDLSINRISHRKWKKNGFIPRSYRDYFIKINHKWNIPNLKKYLMAEVNLTLYRSMRIYKRFFLFHFILDNITLSYNQEIKNINSFRKLMFVNFFRVYKECPWHVPRTRSNKYIVEEASLPRFSIAYANQLFNTRRYEGDSSTVNILLAPFTGNKVRMHEWMSVTYAFITGRLYAREGDDEIIDYLNDGDLRLDGIQIHFRTE